MTSGSNLHTIALYNADVSGHVCPTVRLIEPARAAGIDVLPGCTWDELGQLEVHTDPIEAADLVVVQRDFPRHVDSYMSVVEMARTRNKPIVYELDDLLFDLPSWHPDYRSYRETRIALIGAAQEADAVTTSTSRLREQLCAYNAHVHVLPNYLPDTLWSKALELPIEKHEQEPITIGYMGGHSHIHDIETIQPVFFRLQHAYGERLRFRFWGVRPPKAILAWNNTEWENPALVNYAEFAEYFSKRACDIFIAPLDDSLFSRCKSALKYLEYSALAVPGVYSKVPPFERVITHGEDGYLASSLDEWFEYLKTLIDSVSLRVTVGENARQTVREQHLLSAHAQVWRETYSMILEQHSSQAVDISGHTSHTVQQAHAWHTELEERITEHERRITQQQEKLAEQTQQIEAHKRQIEEDNRQIETLNHRLNSALHHIDTIENSPGWKLIQAVTPLRELLVPRNSLRERALGLLARTLVVLKRDGVRAGIASVQQEIRGYREWKKRGAPATSRQWATEVRAGDLVSMPAISVIVSSDADVDSESVVAWMHAQTLPAARAIVWDREHATAHAIERPEQTWPAPDWHALHQHLNTPYVLFASRELLDWDATYLEANLLALETEGLAFTVNTYAQPQELVSQIERRRIPLHRSVMRLAYVDTAASLDLSTLVNSSDAGQCVAGKILPHTSNRAETDTLSFDVTIAGATLKTSDQYILTAPTTTPLPARETKHTLHPVETVLPVVSVSTERPTILTIFPFLAVGGAERVALDMMKQLHEKLDFVIATVEPHDPELGTMANQFRELTPYVYTATDFVAPDLKLSFLTYLIERFDPHTLYVANGANWIYDVLGTVKEKYPHLRTVNQTYDYQFGWINRYTPDLVPHIDAHIGANARICKAYIERGAPAESVYEIEHVVDTEAFDPAEYPLDRQLELRQTLSIPLNDRVVTFIARIHSQKRPMDFLELARRLSDIPDVTFLMVGDGPLAEKLDAEIARIDLDNLVRHPFYSPSSDIFAISDVVVLPSEYEGMPLVMLEAQAMGVPVVVTDVGNTREVLDITGGGVVVSDIGDISGLKDGVLTMLQTPPDSEHLRHQVQEHLSLEKMAAKYRRALLGA